MLESQVSGKHMVLRSGARTTARAGGGHLIIRDEGRLRVRAAGNHLIIRGHRRGGTVSGTVSGLLWQLVINGCGHWYLRDGETRYAQLWYCGGEDWSQQPLTVYSVPGTSLPSPAESAIQVPVKVGGCSTWSMNYYSNDPHRWAAGQKLHISGHLHVAGATDAGAQLAFRVQWLNAEHAVDDYTDVVEIESLPTAGFTRYAGVVTIPAGAVYWRVWIGVLPRVSGWADGAAIYATLISGMHCRGAASYPDWADGASDDWRWLEEPHQNWAYRVGAEAPGALANPGAAADWGVNLVANPRAHTDASGWADATPVRVTSVPFGDLPDGADAAFQIDADGTTSSEQTIDGTRERLLAVCLQWACVTTNADATTARLYLAVQYYYDDAADWGSDCAFVGHTPTEDRYGSGWAWIEGALDEWHAFSDLIYCPAGVSKVRLYVCVHSDGSSAAADTGYFTQARIGGAVYADGDSSGWEWDGTAHNSTSRKA